jgi:DNA-binding MarR family transcriptional regulator
MDDREEEFVDELMPQRWGRPSKLPRMSAYGALHGAYHVLSRRMAMELRDHNLSPSEAVVLEVLRRYPQATVALVRHLTGLRPSTLDSLLDRLVARELLQRETPRDIRGEVVLAATGSAALMTSYATAALREIEEELRVFVSADTLAALEVVFEGARALGVPGTAADL